MGYRNKKGYFLKMFLARFTRDLHNKAV